MEYGRANNMATNLNSEGKTLHEALKDRDLKPGINYFDGYMVHVSMTGEREAIIRYTLEKKHNEKINHDHPDGTEPEG